MITYRWTNDLPPKRRCGNTDLRAVNATYRPTRRELIARRLWLASATGGIALAMAGIGMVTR